MDKKLIAGTILFTFVVPIMFMKPFEETSLLEYLMQCFVPLTIALVFWANYLWIIPRYDFNPRFRQRFIAQNAILMMVSCAIVALVHVLEFHYFSDAGRPGRPPMRLDTRFFVLCGFRDLLNYSIAIVVAYSICLSSHADTLKRKQQETEMARRDAELRSLRNQISPHFLLNTLNNIYALSAISTERTQSAVMQLSKMLRHMLYDNQSELVTLASEASFISSYVDLMRLRLASNIHVSTHIDVSPDSPTKVSPLLFISLVENAFKTRRIAHRALHHRHHAHRAARHLHHVCHKELQPPQTVHGPLRPRRRHDPRAATTRHALPRPLHMDKGCGSRRTIPLNDNSKFIMPNS